MLKDQTLARQVYESINTVIDAENELFKYASENLLVQFSEVAKMIFELTGRIENISEMLCKEAEGLSLNKSIVSVNDSLCRIIKLMIDDREKALNKIEFELVPLTEECRINFYFWGMVSGDKEKEKKYLEKDVYELAENKYIKESVKNNKWKYDLSIVVLAYNKLDYTKKCISNLFKYYPRWLRTELILINHGSEDETREYFESVNPDKLLDIKVNGGGLNAIYRIIEGRYTLTISNDVYVQYNTIKNLYDCISSDPKVGFVVPSTSNVSNVQDIFANYNNEEELEKFTKKNNYNNSNYREERTRLCNPIDIVDSVFVYNNKVHYQYYSGNPFSFPDDNISLLCRRNGYKMVLVKDAYCYHCGSVTLKSETNTTSENAYQKGRLDFKNRYGIDPWFKCCYSPVLINFLQLDKIKEKKEFSILSIDGGLGSNGLKIKEELKYNFKDSKVYLKYILTNNLYYNDILFLGNQTEVIRNLSELKSENKKYDFILFENADHNIENIIDLLDIFTNISSEYGFIVVESENICKLSEYKLKDVIVNSKKYIIEDQCKWMIIEKICNK